MKAVRIVLPAEQEMLDAAAYYELQVPGLGQDFLAKVASAVAEVTEDPERWPVVRLMFGVALYTVSRTDFCIGSTPTRSSCSLWPTSTGAPPTGSEDREPYAAAALQDWRASAILPAAWLCHGPRVSYGACRARSRTRSRRRARARRPAGDLSGQNRRPMETRQTRLIMRLNSSPYALMRLPMRLNGALVT